MSAAGSLASATSSRVDSASKHIQPCKVNTDYMISLLEAYCDAPARELQNNKMRYCMHKDEFVIGLGRPVFGQSIHMNSKRAYPSVITNLGRMQDQAKRFMALLNFTTISFADAHVLKDLIFAVMDSATPAGVDRLTAGNAKAIPSSPAMLAEFLASCTTANQPGNLIQGLSNSSTIKSQIQHSLQMYFVGVSLGLAYAHPNSGDTVASVMIGGLRTVQNGDYHVHTNDLLMFYFDEERDLFERDGSRIDRKTTCSAPATEAERVRFLLTFFHDGTVVPHADNTDRASRKEMERKVYYDRGNGNFPGRESNEKANTFRIKPYIVSRHKISADHHHSQHFPCDKARVFGRAISNAQPFEMVDIQLSRQAI